MLVGVPTVGVGSKASIFKPTDIAGLKLWLAADNGINSGALPVNAPTDIAGCKLWLRGDLGVTQAGGVVSQWNDQSGNGAHASQATTSRKPAYLASGINGLPGLTFSNAGGAEARLDNTTVNLTAAGGARTAFFVHRANSASKFNNFISFRRSAPGNVWELSSDAAGPFYVATDGASYNGSLVSAPIPAVSGNNWIAEFSMPSNGGSPGSGLTVTLNGAAKALNVTSTGGETGGATGFALGDRLDGGAGFANDFTLYEAVLFDTELSASNRDRLRMYFANRYGIGIAVSAWVDQSGIGNSAGPGAGPVNWNPAGINGHPSLTFTGANSLRGAASFLNANSPRTVFFVHKPTNQVAYYNCLLTSRRSGAGHNFCIGGGVSGSNMWINDRQDGARNESVPFTPTNGTGYYTCHTWNGNLANNYGSRINGAGFTVTSGGSPPPTEAGLTSGYCLGGEGTDGYMLGYAGEFGEALAYDTVLSAPNIASVEAFLKAKWGL